MRAETLRAVPDRPPTPSARLLADLPIEWRGEVLGPSISGWADMIERGRGGSINLAALSYRLRIELAWMAHWQFRDGVKIGVGAFNQIAKTLEWAATHGRTVGSLSELDLVAFSKTYAAWFESRHERRPGRVGDRLRTVFGYARLALIARLSDEPWWQMDTWAPRCDPRIPLRDREPRRSEGCRPGAAEIPWLRAGFKWYLGTTLEAGTLSWSTISGDRVLSFVRFDRWLSTLPSPSDITGDITQAGAMAAQFRRWGSDPTNRSQADGRGGSGVRRVNDDLRAVADLMAFTAENRAECRSIVGPSPWDRITAAHSAIWRGQITREHSKPLINDRHYVDDHALSQIIAQLPMLGERHPQVMRMLLLQILTGRRASEICMCEFDCLSPATDRAIETAEGEQVARFHYAQSKIDRAPDTILVDAEVVAVIEEQQQWVRDQFPSIQPRYLFPQQSANARGSKHISAANYRGWLREFSELANISDSTGRPVRLSNTHRFRHTRITRLAELGLPVHVLQRYAGHANPTMSMHYVAQREEHAEQAFLATRKYKANGTAVTFSREDHDGMHLFDRADRFLPHGYCLLPPLQTCDKGNACLTCSVFVTDSSHTDTLRRQLGETKDLIQRQRDQFQARHGQPMPDGNVWLTQRTAELGALERLLAAMQENLGRSCQGAGSSTAGPTPLSLDLTRHRRTQS
ncbi:tyrosine-type recombinase/integrase [Nocardia sp. NPDC059764]|uniref:tyrosine-type recombinase/integrase n=1 Tax=Nocardia sp. NPDC059764 TaxID=3346939 RepID=UPI003650F06F